MMKNKKNSHSFIPADYQPGLPERILNHIPEGETLKLNALFIGAGPASLAGAIRLAQLYKGQDFQIGILEKAGRLGGHSLSGAVINPLAFQKLFPDMNPKDWPFRQKVCSEKMYYLTAQNKIPLPLPPTMKNKDFFTASLCEVVRWLGGKAQELGVDIFTGASAEKLIVQNDRVIGVQTTPMGLDRSSQKTAQYQEPITLLADTVFIADGVRGNLSGACLKWKNISSFYPEHYALGVKEIWKVRRAPQAVMHTVGWPLKGFGGSFLYPLSKEHIAIGLVGALDSKDHNIGERFQEMKTHPFFKKILEGGQCLEWGAKAIPEGGFYSIPDKISGPGFFILGDSAHLVHVPSLKGVHYAMLSGILAGEYLFNQKKPQPPFEDLLKNHPLVGRELYKVRNVVQTLQNENFLTGMIKVGLMILSGGRFPGDLNPKNLAGDSQKPRLAKTLTGFPMQGQSSQDSNQPSNEAMRAPASRQSAKPAQSPLSKFRPAQTKSSSQSSSSTDPQSSSVSNLPHISKQDLVYLSGNKTRDDIPPHLTLPNPLPPEGVQNFYTHFCPAGVYERKNNKLIINYPNCIDCKATDILGPRWNPREGGSGPDYSLM